MFDTNYNPLFDCVPRNKQSEGEFSTTFDFIPRTDCWKVQNSFYFREEYMNKLEKNLSLSNQCFEMDWSRSKLPKIIREKHDKEELKIVLKNVYSNIIDTYVSLASETLENDRFIFTKTTLLDFCIKSGLNSHKSVSYDEIAFVQNSVIDEETPVNNSFANQNFSLKRYQFLEFLVKIAYLKYSKKNPKQNYSGAFKHLLEDGLFAYLNNFSCEQWRIEKLWKEECEKLLHFYFILINGLFKSFAESKFYKNQSFMTKLEFFHLSETSQITQDKVFEPIEQIDLNLAFSLSVAKQIDENSDRSLIMNFMEFFEGLARIADKLSPNPLQESVNYFIY